MADRNRLKQAVSGALDEWGDHSARSALIDDLDEFGSPKQVAIRIGLGIHSMGLKPAVDVTTEFLEQEFFGQTLLSTAIRRNPAILADVLDVFKPDWAIDLLEIMHQLPAERVSGKLPNSVPGKVVADTSVSVFDEGAALLCLTVLQTDDANLFKLIVNWVLFQSRDRSLQTQILSFASGNTVLKVHAAKVNKYAKAGGWPVKRPDSKILAVRQGLWPANNRLDSPGSGLSI